MLRALVLGIMGLLLASVGVVAFVGLQPVKPQAAAVPPRLVSVLVAGKALRAGSLLQPGDLSARDIDAAQVPAGARADGNEARNALVGAMLRRSKGDREPIVSDDVLRPGDRGFLAAVLAPGTRAVSVAVDAVSGEAGLIWPGDRVDVILTQEIEGVDQTLGHRVAGETVMSDVRVIAVDQQLVQGGQASGLLEGRSANSRTITLEVTPYDAARLAVAMRLGKLQVVLRAAEPAAPTTAQVLAPFRPRTPVQSPGQSPGQLSGQPSVQASAQPAARSGGDAAEAPQATSATVWGGDVSRALGGGAVQRNVEVKLFQGSRQVEAYKF